MHRLLLTLCAVSGLLPGASAQLVNGGAESGALAPWIPDLQGAPTGHSAIIKSVQTQVQTEPAVGPALGARFFSFATQPAGPAGSFVELSQVVAVGTAPAVLALSGLVQTEYGDFGDVRLDALDAGAQVLASVDSGPHVSDGEWSLVFVPLALPAGTTQCRVTLRGTVAAGTAVNVFWDGLALAPNPWSQLGPGLSGSLGLPTIAGFGTLLPDEPFGVSLAQALPLATAHLVVGLSLLGVPFKGGLMVPHPDILFALPTDAAGALEVGGLWPVGVPSGTHLYVQWWVQDPAGPVGFAATRGLQGSAP